MPKGASVSRLALTDGGDENFQLSVGQWGHRQEASEHQQWDMQTRQEHDWRVRWEEVMLSLSNGFPFGTGKAKETMHVDTNREMCLHVWALTPLQTLSPPFWCKWLLDMLRYIKHFIKLCVNSYLLQEKLKNVSSISTCPMNFIRLNSSHREDSKVQYMQRRQNTKCTHLSLNCGSQSVFWAQSGHIQIEAKLPWCKINSVRCTTLSVFQQSVFFHSSEQLPMFSLKEMCYLRWLI